MHIRTVSPRIHPGPAIIFKPDGVESVQVENRADVTVVFETLVTEPGGMAFARSRAASR